MFVFCYGGSKMLPYGPLICAEMCSKWNHKIQALLFLLEHHRQKSFYETYNRCHSTLDNKHGSSCTVAVCVILTASLNPPHCCCDLLHFQLLSLNCNSNFTQRQLRLRSLPRNNARPFWLEWDSGFKIWLNCCLFHVFNYKNTKATVIAAVLIPPRSANYVVLIEVFLLRRHTH